MIIVHMHETTNHLIESLPNPADIRQSLKRNQAERSILRQMLKLAVRAQDRQWSESDHPVDQEVAECK